MTDKLDHAREDLIVSLGSKRIALIEALIDAKVRAILAEIGFPDPPIGPSPEPATAGEAKRIADLEALLNSEGDEQIEIMPDGSVRPMGGTGSIGVNTPPLLEQLRDTTAALRAAERERDELRMDVEHDLRKYWQNRARTAERERDEARAALVEIITASDEYLGDDGDDDRCRTALANARKVLAGLSSTEETGGG